jgi:hypothetical protein
MLNKVNTITSLFLFPMFMTVMNARHSYLGPDKVEETHILVVDKPNS